jgi:hypothetical protein
MMVQKLSTGRNHGSADRLNGDAAESRHDDYSMILADRRVEEASHRVAEQIRVVAEIEAAGEPSETATELLQELELELKTLTERRETARREACQGAQPETEGREAG